MNNDMNELEIFIKNCKSIRNKIKVHIFDKKVNIVLGKNGLGKSNLLDAIYYLCNPMNNIDSEPTNKFEGSKADLNAEICIKYNLIKSEKEELLDILKKLNVSDLIKESNFLFYKFYGKDKDYLYKYLYNREDSSQTPYGRIVENVLKKHSELLLGAKIIKRNENNVLELLSDEDVDTRLKSKQLQQKQKIQEIVNNLRNIEKIFKHRIKVFYIKNAELENKINFIYNLEDINENNDDFLGLLNFIDYNAIIDIKKIISLSNSDNDVKEKIKICERLEQKANEKLKNLFNNFEIYAYPRIKFDSNTLKVIVQNKIDTYEFDAMETGINSSGYKSFFYLMLKLETAKFIVNRIKYQQVIVLIDEPDKNLHPILQQQLSNFLKNFTENNSNIFLLLTTHSPFLIPGLNQNILLAERDLSGSTRFELLSNIYDNLHLDVSTSNIFPLLVALELVDENNPLSLMYDRKNIYFQGANKELEMLKDFFKSSKIKLNFVSTEKMKDKITKNMFEIMQKSFKKVDNLEEFDDITDTDSGNRALITNEAFKNIELKNKKSNVKQFDSINGNPGEEFNEKL